MIVVGSAGSRRVEPFQNDETSSPSADRHDALLAVVADLQGRSEHGFGRGLAVWHCGPTVRRFVGDLRGKNRDKEADMTGVSR